MSFRLQDVVINRLDQVLDTIDPFNHNTLRRVVQFMRNIRQAHQPLLEKCNKKLLCSIHMMNAENINIILGLYEDLEFNNCDFRMAAKQRLTELVDSCTDSSSFTKLFVALGPMASPEIRERFVPVSVELSVGERLTLRVMFECHRCLMWFDFS